MLNLLEITCNKYDKYIGKAGENYRIILQADISFSNSKQGICNIWRIGHQPALLAIGVELALLIGGKGWDQQETEATLLIRSRQRGYNPSPVQFTTDQLPVPNSHKSNKNNVIKKKS